MYSWSLFKTPFHFLQLRNMFRLLCKIPTKTALASHLFQNPSLKTVSQTTRQLPLIQYLTDSCFLSQESALSAVKKLKGRNQPRNSDSILAFLSDHGFSRTHISNLIPKLPEVLYFRVDSNLRPKMEFFKEIGLSEPDIADFLCSHPIILCCNLEKKIKPFFGFIHSISGTHETMLKALQQSSCFFRSSLENVLVPNVTLLQSCNVPNSSISRLFITHPRAFLLKPDMFRENVKFVKEMGFNPSTRLFVDAVRAIGSLSRATWKRKFETYRSLGWSDEKIFSAFRKHPGFLTMSEEKIRKGMAFFAKELGWSPSFISLYPSLLLFSLEKRILPRHKVLQVLNSMGLVKKKLDPISSFFTTEKKFLEEYVLPYYEIVPELMNFYLGGVALTIPDSKEEEAPEVWQL